MPVIFVFLLAVLAGVSCSVTRKLPEESYLVQKVTVEADKETPKKERIPASDLRKFIRQNPNKRFLGLNFYVWVYEQADPEKDNWWNRFKRRIGEAPVLLDMSLTEQSVRNLKVYMDYRGFFSSQATYEADTTPRKKRAFICSAVSYWTGLPAGREPLFSKNNSRACSNFSIPLSYTCHSCRKGSTKSCSWRSRIR